MANVPNWFNESWLDANKESIFVKRLRNTVYAIEMDKNISGKNKKPMQATIECLMGDVAADATKFQYAEALKEMEKLTGDDKIAAADAVERVKAEYAEYMDFLTS